MKGKSKTTVALIGLGAVLVLVAILLFQDLGDSSDVRSSSPDSPSPSKQNVSQSIRDKIAHLRSVVGRDSNNVQAMLDLAHVLHDAHDLSNAVQLYARVVQREPANEEARIDYSLCLSELGRTEEAMKQSRLVLFGNPENPQGLFNLGALHANSGANDSAVVYWKALIKRHPENALAARAKENLATLSGSGATSR